MADSSTGNFEDLILEIEDGGGAQEIAGQAIREPEMQLVLSSATIYCRPVLSTDASTALLTDLHCRMLPSHLTA
jgi:hypothetical protein